MKIRHLYISRGHNYYGQHGKPPNDYPIEAVREIECVAGSGIRGDRFFDYKEDYKGQITFFSQEVYDDLSKTFEVSAKSPAAFRRNVIVEGVDLNDLIGEEFEVQGVRFSGSCEAAPCYWMNQAFADGAHDALKGRGGLRARILSDGVLRVDE